MELSSLTEIIAVFEIGIFQFGLVNDPFPSSNPKSVLILFFVNLVKFKSTDGELLISFATFVVNGKILLNSQNSLSLS
jgi:hypothetical protein